MNRKENRKYTFSVEGQTELWYLQWLEDTINSNEESRYNVAIKVTVSRSPRKYIKSVIPISTDKITHVCDVERNDPKTINSFRGIIDELEYASKLKDVEYDLGYSNLTFELWIILHKKACNGHQNGKSDYLKNINKAFGESFVDLSDFKKEPNFKRCLSKLSLNDVKNAIQRADAITSKNEKDDIPKEKYKGYCFYKDNPALSIHEIIRQILDECNLTP